MKNIDGDAKETNIRTNDTTWEGAVWLNKNTDVFTCLSLLFAKLLWDT